MSKALGGYLRVLLELSSIWYMNNIYPKRCQESVHSPLLTLCAIGTSFKLLLAPSLLFSVHLIM